MGFLSNLFGSPKPTPVVIIYNALHEEIDRVQGVWDLSGVDVRGRNWSHADLSGLSFYGAQCDGINLFGARLYRTDFQKASLRRAELAFSYAAGANFRSADLRECSLYRAEIGLGRRHSSAILLMPWSTRPQTFQSIRFLVSGGCREGHTPDLLFGDRHPCSRATVSFASSDP
jgi:hypothetical protein